jgi:tRNA-uridine 2-sulfurtransferase
MYAEPRGVSRRIWGRGNAGEARYSNIPLLRPSVVTSPVVTTPSHAGGVHGDAPAPRIGVGMSGGVDSSVAAALLVEKGFRVIGFTARMWREGSRCCSVEDIAHAAKVADTLGIRHYIIDTVPFFRERVVEPFVDEYARGRTPSPCVRCNQVIKFGALLRDVMELGCTHIATGHYARVERRGETWHLLRGNDAAKDQSYFLHRLYQAQLARVVMPLGEWTKPKTVAYAKEKNLPAQQRGESQDLCFIREEEGYVPFVEKYRPDIRRRGAIVDSTGKQLGEHEGIHRFTVGQREGLGIAAGAPVYVKELRPETNEVVVGTRDEVVSRSCILGEVHWIAGSPPPEGTRCSVQLRYRHKGAACGLRVLEGGSVCIDFEEPQFAVTPGQAAVFYTDDEVLGGGWIASPKASER